MLLARNRLALRLLRANNARAYSAGTGGPNHAILEMLKSSRFVQKDENHADLLMLLKDKEEEAQSPDRNQYKIRAFTSAIRVISELDHPIQSATEAKAVSRCI
jgi:hypothetical protein